MRSVCTASAVQVRNMLSRTPFSLESLVARARRRHSFAFFRQSTAPVIQPFKSDDAPWLPLARSGIFGGPMDGRSRDCPSSGGEGGEVGCISWSPRVTDFAKPAL